VINQISCGGAASETQAKKVIAHPTIATAIRTACMERVTGWFISPSFPP
jgi:hypothetical protein